MEAKVILFDAGNTLVWLDHLYLVELLREHGIEVAEEEVLAAEYPAKQLLDDLIRSGNGATDATRGRIYFSAIFRQLGVPDSVLPGIAAKLEARHAERNLWSRVQPGTAEALRELRQHGYRMGVISNSDGRVEALLRAAGLAEYFDFVIDSQVVGVEKPDPRIFRLGCERAGVRPEEAIYVGDIFEIDVAGARSVGMRAVLIDPLGRWGELECDRIAGVHELPARLASRRSGGWWRPLLPGIALVGLGLLLGSCSGGGPQARLECIAPANPGGGWDLTCRTLAQAFRELELAPGAMRVRNVPGAGGGVAFSNVVAQQPNHEGLLVAASPSTLLGLAQNQYGRFTEDDVRWLAAVGAEASVVAVRADAPWRTLDELASAWRANPGSIAVGGGSAVGGQDHMKTLVFARTIGIRPQDVRYVPFDGGGEAMTALLGGFVQVFPGDASETLGQLEAGNVRLLAVLSPEREGGLLADTPTARELGYDLEWLIWRGFYAPPNISDEAYDRWIQRLSAMVASGQWPQLLARNGLSPYFRAGPDFQALVTEQTTSFRALSREIGLLQ